MFESICIPFNFTQVDNKSFIEQCTGVINLSDRKLSKEEIQVLGKGLKFCPTPPVYDHGKLKESIDKFFRSISLHLFFNSETIDLEPSENIPEPMQSPFKHPELKLKSTFSPQMPSNLEFIYHKVVDEILYHIPSKNRYRNLTNAQYSALQELQNDCNIVIKKADKGSNIVIMNTHDYIEEGMRQLNNKQFYRKETKNLTPTHKQRIDSIIEELFQNNEISESTFKYLLNDGERTSIFYMLPKIHKNRDNPPGRPIVSSNDCPTEKISQMIDIILKPLIVQNKSYIEDTPDFLRKIQNIEMTDEDWLISLDVSSLYTNIPHKDGLRSVEMLLRTKRKGMELPTNGSILKLLKCVLTMNNFMFNNEHYIQIQGTAMGTRVAPTYANIFMNNFEEKYVYLYPKNIIRKWYRFIDDIWAILRCSEKELKTFLHYLNHVDNNIQFTYMYSKTSVQFLDVMTYRSKNEIKTDLYVKPTDSHSYLEYSSCHPMNMKNSIPYSQFLRLRRNCSDWTKFISHSLQLVTYFELRGYPTPLLHTELTKVNTLLRAECLKKSENTIEKKQFFCIVDFNPTNPEIRKIIDKAMSYADRSSSTRNILDIPIVYGYRKPKNIADYVVRSDLPKTDSQKRHSFPPKCQRFLRCNHCPYIRNTKTRKIISHSTKREYKIPYKVTCNSSNLIYCIQCPKCELQYVGQTKNKLLTRMNQHHSDIRLKKDTPVSRHINKCTEKNIFHIYILQLILKDDNTLRDKNENYWISRLHTLTPEGMNILD